MRLQAVQFETITQEEGAAMSDPNWHRSTENYDPGAPCICGHPLECHEPIDAAPCEECDCEAFSEKDYDPSDDEAFTDRDEYGRIR